MIARELVKHFDILLELPMADRPIRYRYRAPAGKQFTPADREKYIEAVAEDIEKRFPHWNFRFVELAAARYKFIYQGLRAPIRAAVPSGTIETAGAAPIDGIPELATSTIAEVVKSGE